MCKFRAVQSKTEGMATSVRVFFEHPSHFQISNITQEQVSVSIIMTLDSSKAIGLDGIGPRIIKYVANILSLIIAALINKSIATGKFQDKLKLAKVFPHPQK